MKKILLSICIIFSINSFGQSCSLDGVTASLTLQFRHWKWAASKIGIGTDSISTNRMRAFRTQMLAANPATDATNVTINNVPGEVIEEIYKLYIFNNTFAEYFNMGATDAERRTIFTNIRALGNPCIIERVAIIDAQATGFYNNTQTRGHYIIF
jgi:hypothetical protein